MNFFQLRSRAFECLEQDNYSEAIDLYQECIDANPTEISDYWYLGLALLLQGNEEEAQVIWLSAISQGDSEQLEAKTAELVEILSGEAWRYQKSQDWQRAEKIYQQILQQFPERADLHYNLGYSLYKQNKFVEAVFHYYQVLTFQPDAIIARQKFIKCLEQVSFSESVSPQLLKEIETCFTTPGIDPQSPIPVTIAALQVDDDSPRLFKLAQNNQKNIIEAEYIQGMLDRVLSKSLFQTLLQQTILADLTLENLLTLLRKTTLVTFTANPRSDGFNFKFLCSLALQCFNNEYIYTVSKEEQLLIGRLKLEIEEKTFQSELWEIKLVIYSMYYPLHTLFDCLIPIPEESWSLPIRTLIKRHLQEYQEEIEIGKNIISLTSEENSVSLAVKSQYEENPYPRWLGFTISPAQSIYDYLRSIFPYFQPPLFLTQPIQIFEAGCGTGRNAIYWATLFNNAEILAVDFSLSSVTYAIRKAKEFGISNIVFRQGDILGLANWERQFKVIVSTGVLHHLENPVMGWKILVDLLEPLGMMKIGLYSEKARQSVKAAREYIKTKGFSAAKEGIRESRQEIFKLDENNLAREVIHFSDFYSLSECRDLLFHVQEHRFTLPQIANILQELGLRFVGFDIVSEKLKEIYKQTFPEDPELTNLLLWDKFEDTYPDTFLKMYQFWCQKNPI